MCADINQYDISAVANKHKHNTVVVVQRKSPQSAEFAAEFMCFKASVMRVLNKQVHGIPEFSLQPIIQSNALLVRSLKT